MSIFNLKTNVSELRSANQGMSKTNFQQVTATRDVTTSNFPNGLHHYRWEHGGTQWHVPSMSYFRIRYRLNQVRTGGNTLLPPITSGDLAPNMGLASNIFQSAEIRLNGKTLQRIGERMPQLDALKTRMKKSKAWIDSVGAYSNHWQYNFTERKNQISVNGYQSEVSQIDLQYGTPVSPTDFGYATPGVTTLAYSVADEILVFASGTTPDLLVNQVLAPGDRIVTTLTTYEIIEIISATTAHVKIVGATGNVIQAAVALDTLMPSADPQVTGFQRISSSSHNDITAKNEYEIIWQPPLGYFDIEHAIPPGGKWELVLNPQNSAQYQKRAVESINADLTSLATSTTAGGVAGNFNFEITNMHLYLYTLDGSRFDSGTYYLDLMNIRCQVDNMPANSTGVVQRNFEVHQNSNAITLAFQDQTAGTSTLFSESKFKIRPNTTAPDGQDLLLTRFFIQYANQTKPQPDFDGQYTHSNTVATQTTDSQISNLSQRYAETLLNTGSYFTEGGTETLQDWIKNPRHMIKV